MGKSLVESIKFHKETLNALLQKEKENKKKLAIYKIKMKTQSIRTKTKEIHRLRKEISEIKKEFDIIEEKKEQSSIIKDIIKSIINNSTDIIATSEIVTEVKKKYFFRKEKSLISYVSTILGQLVKENEIIKPSRGIYSKISYRENNIDVDENLPEINEEEIFAPSEMNSEEIVA